MAEMGVPAVLASHWATGGRGAADLAGIVVELCEREPSVSFVYDDHDTLWEKIEKISRKIYRASNVDADQKVRDQITRLQDDGYGRFAVCVAKTQYSFSTDPRLRGAPSDHAIDVHEVRLSAGAEFVVMVCGNMMTMPGLPMVPAARAIDLNEDGRVVGLF
jgi:formate--tetrahydrofolate ligase